MSKNIIKTALSLALFAAALTFAGSAHAASTPAFANGQTSSITGSSATLNGQYWPNGATTSTWFKYSTSSTLAGAQSTPIVQESQTSGNHPVTPRTISGLTSSTTYYFRLYGLNSAGSAYASGIGSFTTTTGGGTGPGTGGSQLCSIDTYGTSATINSGSSATLSWNTSNCDNVSISNIGSEPVVGSTQVSPTSTTTYEMTASGPAGNTTYAYVTITVNTVVITQNCSINTFTATPNYINSGDTTTVNWTTSNCTSVNVTGGGISSTSLSGSIPSSALYSSTTFYITANGTNGQVSQSVPVTVNTVVVNNQCTVSSLTANPNSITLGSTIYLYWNATNCTSFTLSGPGVSNNYYGGTSSATIAGVNTSGSFILTGYGNGSSSATTYVSVNGGGYVYPINNYNYNSCSISSFYSDPTQISAGNAAMLHWNTQNCSSVTISGTGINNSQQSPSGTLLTGALYNNTTFTLNAYGQNGNQTQQVTVSVTPVSTFINSVTPIYTPPTQTIIRYITGNTNPTTTSTNPVVFGTSVEANPGTYAVGNNLAGLSLWGASVLPTSLVGILLIVLLIMGIMLLVRNIYNTGNQDGQTAGHH